MPDINISHLRADVLDRLDNGVIGQQIPEPLRQKLTSVKRVTRALNQALVLFLADADLATVQPFQKKVALSPDTEVGVNGIVNNVTTYKWPEEAFTARVYGGLIKMILNDEERYFEQASNSSIESVRSQANSTLYGSGQAVFHADLVAKRIYVPSNVSVSARIITEPETLTDTDAYGDATGAPAVIPISTAFFQTLSELAFYELIKTAQISGSRPTSDADTDTQESSQQQDN